MKTIKSYPWTKAETAWLKQAIKDHPEWTNATMYNQFKYANPYTSHTKKATASKINTLRPSKGRCKWDAKAHTKLAQLYDYELPIEGMAEYFGVTTSAIQHQLHKIKNLGMIKFWKDSPGRQAKAHERVIKPELKNPEVVKQLNLGLNREDAVAKANKLSANIRNIDESVEKLMSKPMLRTSKPAIRTATEIMQEQLKHQSNKSLEQLRVETAANVTQGLLQVLELIK